MEIKEYGGEYEMQTRSKDNVVLALIGQERNREFLKKVPHTKLLDLALIFTWLIRIPDEQGKKAVTVPWRFLAEEGISKEELFQVAMENTSRILPGVTYPLGEELCVISNLEGFFGSAAVLYRGMLKDIAERFQDNLYIIPSSVHEMISLPASILPAEKIRETIRDANRNVVSAEEVLSDQLYYYDRKAEWLTFAQTGMETVFPQEKGGQMGKEGIFIAKNGGL